MKKLKRRICKCKAQIETVRTLPYYTLFNRMEEREADLNRLGQKLKSLQSQYAARCVSGFNPGLKTGDALYNVL